ncbi:thiamine pyrophosphate-binding protein [Pseudomonas sp. Gutcm_11s]|uniref:thiamine pyrophosphate-binding protein n=1 Tax=Pseudomonas sp. Gutcm_11s TaxID=3026088 RepID=UPI002361E173|nr:thiamine pyrophosphate-binding protein [Pseudomonas sp. Gutcm_11s]MDD0843482.1 thiamine pyrophosphate-binding protein [Pseudomonas sp. Gutcm_11s]
MSYLVHDRMLELMEAEGIKTLFGIPDPSFIGMFTAAEKRGWTVVAPHHEQSGAFMADAHWRTTGIPGVVVGNQGPGVANLAAAAICAAKENVPTIFIAGQRERVFDQRVKRGQFQYTRQPKHFEESMKYVGIIEYAEQVDEVFREAFRRALSGTPGPVYIEYPMNVLDKQIDLGPLLKPEQYRLVHQAADTQLIAEAVELLSSAKAPILLVGQGVHVSRAHTVVAELAQALACPVIQTPGGSGVLPGVESRTFSYASPVGIRAVAEADVVIAIGTEIGEQVHYGVGRHWAQGNTDRKWIYIERDVLAIGVNRPIDVPLVGDLRDIAPQLSAALRPLQRQASAQLIGLEASAAKFRAGMLAHVPTTSQPVHPARLVVEATKDLPDNVLMVRDGGSFSMFAGAFTQVRSSDVLWSQNFGHLGMGLPVAIGAQLMVGDSRRVVLLSGDSAFLFHISELETAVRKNLPVVCVIGCDYAWGLEVAVYRNAFGMESAETEAHWGKQLRLDIVAQGFGAHGEFVERAEDIAPAIQRALASNKPAVVQVVMDGNANTTDMPGIEEFMSWYGERGY